MSGAQRFTVGRFECWLLEDGTNLYPPEWMVVNAEPGEYERAIEAYLDPGRLVPSTYHALLVDAGGTLVLVDAGMGDLGGPDSTVGRLGASLAEAGVSAGDIGVVLLSHGHPDHIGGLTVATEIGRAPTYPGARHHLWRSEWEFWTSPAVEALPEMMQAAASATFPVLAASGLIEPIAEETDVVPGIRFVPAPGHTPGHAGVAVTSNGEGLLYVADAVVHEVNFEHPEWLSAFDAIPEQTVASRRRLLDAAAADGASIVAFHIGRGWVQPAGEAYRFERA